MRVDTTPLPSEEMVYCNNLEFDVADADSIPEQCKKFMFSIGAAIQEKALCTSTMCHSALFHSLSLAWLANLLKSCFCI